MPAVELVPPVYDGPGVASLVPALLGAGDRSWLPELARGARQLVLLVLDGVGADAVEGRPDIVPTLAAMQGGAITTVAPSTTAAALTSISTGLAPSQHGLIGYRVRVDGVVLNALSWQVDGHRGPDPHSVQRNAPFRGRPVPVVTKSEFRTTGFTEAHLRGAPFHGWRAVSTLVEHVRRLVAAGEPLVYAYYPGVDEVAHAHGLEDGYYAAELAFADRLVADVVHAVGEDTAVLVTADHGQVHLEADSWIDLKPLSELVDVCSGDGRFRGLHARRGAQADLAAAAEELYGTRAWVRTREALLDDGWLGPPPPTAVRRRLGDVYLAAAEPVAFTDPVLPREAELRSGHGSLTTAEMRVPLVAARGLGGVAPGG